MRTIDSIYSPYHTIEDKIAHTKHKKINKMLSGMYLPIERMHVTELDDLDNIINMDHWHYKNWRNMVAAFGYKRYKSIM
jgi:hypothetical protein